MVGFKSLGEITFCGYEKTSNEIFSETNLKLRARTKGAGVT